MKKLLVALLSIGLVSPVFAQNNYTIESVTPQNDTLVVKLKQASIPFHLHMKGMPDNNEQSIARGKKEGVALQYFLAHNDLEVAQVDKIELVKDVDHFTNAISKYFKQHPELKGGFFAQFTIFPGYKQPYQIDLKNAPAEYLKTYEQLNKAIKEKSVCNKEQMCQITVGTTSKFINFDNTKVAFNNIELQKFLEKEATSTIDVFTKNKEYLKPITYFLVYGTNGYHVEKEQVKKVMGL